jgi:hypothetical protein
VHLRLLRRWVVELFDIRRQIFCRFPESLRPGKFLFVMWNGFGLRCVLPIKSFLRGQPRDAPRLSPLLLLQPNNRFACLSPSASGTASAFATQEGTCSGA